MAQGIGGRSVGQQEVAVHSKRRSHPETSDCELGWVFPVGISDGQEVGLVIRRGLGAGERPSLWRLEFHEDPEHHVVLQQVHPQSEESFFKEISERVAGSDAEDAFVFVHGYSVSFEDAALRTAQLAYDLGFKGAPILYSWPSKARLLGYLDDEKSIPLTVENLNRFLYEMAQRSGAKRVHLVAHSMGNRALLRALQQLEEGRSLKDMSQFRHVVLAAPDVDRDVFAQLAKQIARPPRLTLYVSSSDRHF